MKKKILVSLSKADLVEEKEIKKLKKLKFKAIEEPTLIFSAVSGYGINELLDRLWEIIRFV